MSQRIGREVDSSTAVLLSASTGLRVEAQGRAILPEARATLEDEPAPGRAQCAVVAADNFPLGHNC